MNYEKYILLITDEFGIWGAVDTPTVIEVEAFSSEDALNQCAPYGSDPVIIAKMPLDTEPTR